MNHRFLIVAFAAAFFSIASFSACAHATPMLHRAEVDAETAAALDAANTAFSAAWVAGDIDALVNAYTEVAIVHPPAGGVLTTRDQIRGLWAPLANQQRVGHRLEPTLRWAIGERSVLEMGRWHASRTVDGQSLWQSGCYTVIWNLGYDGRWRMDYDAWSAPNDASWACRPRVD